MAGRQTFGPLTTLQVNNLVPGFYFLRVRDEAGKGGNSLSGRVWSPGIYAYGWDVFPFGDSFLYSAPRGLFLFR
jgi:hypothetical protein